MENTSIPSIVLPKLFFLNKQVPFHNSLYSTKITLPNIFEILSLRKIEKEESRPFCLKLASINPLFQSLDED